MIPNKDNDSNYDNSESPNSNVFNDTPREEQQIPQGTHGGQETDEGTVAGYYSSPDDKYLALEQDGVQFTEDSKAPLLNSDHVEDGMKGVEDKWKLNGENTRNSDAFNQDDYLLEDNLDLDEDQFKSISSDDDVEDINTNDG